MLSILLPLFLFCLLAFTQAPGFYGSSGDINPLLPGCPAFAAADQTIVT